MFKLIVLDVDDTIITSKNKLSPVTKQAISKAQRQGVKFVLASGRMHQAMKSLAAELAIDLPLVSCNGALIKDAQRTLSRTVVDSVVAKEVIDYFQARQRVLQLYREEGVYSLEKCEYTWRLEESEGVSCTIVDEQSYSACHDNLLKLLIRLQPQEVAEYRERVKNHFSGRLSSALSHNVYLEMTGHNVNKGQALAFLAGQLGLASHEIMAIGDSPNDKKMLQWAGMGIAMGNASPEVKAVADKVTLSVDEDGVAAVLEEYIIRPTLYKGVDFNAR